MTWLNPWAWWGLAALAVPAAIHLLTRAQPKPQPFPTLRFLTQATSTAVRRRTIKDRALLAIRLGLLAAVLAALAQPMVRRADTGAGAPVVRAIVIDAGVSAAVARERVAQLTPAAAESVSTTADRLAPAIARAATWLGERGGRGELVVVSAFRRGDLEQADLAPVSRDVGVRLVKIDAAASTTTSAPAERVAGQLWTPRLSLDADRTTVTWTSSPAGVTSMSFLRVLAAAGDRETVAAALNAASVIGVPVAGAHPIAIVWPDAPDRAAAIAGTTALDDAWLFDAVDALRRDPVLEAAAARIADAMPPAPVPSATTVARDANGSAVIEGTSSGAASGHELRLFVRTRDPLLLSALVASASRSESDPNTWRRLEPVTLTTDELRRWERPLPPAGTPAKSPDAGDWEGRWLWIAVLALFGLETWMRRNVDTSAPVEVTHARVA